MTTNLLSGPLHISAIAAISAIVLVACGDHEEGSNRGTGGVSTGGSGGATGGRSTGGAGMGGARAGGAAGSETGGAAGSETGGSESGGAGGGGGAECFSIAFEAPTPASPILDSGDDEDGDPCGSGFEFTVTADTGGAPDGTATSLVVDGFEVAATTTSSGRATFDRAPLNPDASNTLRVTVGDESCYAELDVLVECGGAPSLAFLEPADGAEFSLSSVDSSSNVGFQRDVRVLTSDCSSLATLSVGGTDTFALPAVEGANCVLTFQSVDLPDSDDLVLLVTQNGGSSQASIVVDRIAPAGISTNLSSVVLDRREARGQIGFDAPPDVDGASGSDRAADSYEVRVLSAGALVNDSGLSDCSIVETNFADGVLVDGPLPSAPGDPELIEIPELVTGFRWCVGVRALDAVGNAGPIATFPAIEPQWLREFVDRPSGAAASFASSMASLDADGDGLLDLAAWSDVGVFIYYNTSAGLESTPRVNIKGPTAQFGNILYNLGRVGDSARDLLGASLSSGGLLVFDLPAALKTQAYTEVTVDGAGESADAFKAALAVLPDATLSGTALGARAANVADFTGDGIDDFVIGAPFAGGLTGRGFLVRGRALTTPAPTDPPVTVTLPGHSEIEFLGDGGAVEVLGYSIAGLGNAGLSLPGNVTGSVVFGSSRAAAADGKVWTFLGEVVADGAHLLRNGPTHADITFSGASGQGDGLGDVVKNVGDIDGDGLEDFVVSSFDGTAYRGLMVVYGGATLGARQLLANTDLAPTPATDIVPNAVAEVLPYRDAPARLSGADAAWVVFTSARYNGANPDEAWAIPPGPRAQSSDVLADVAVAIPLGAGFGPGSSAAVFAGPIRGDDVWPDLVLESLGRLVILY